MKIEHKESNVSCPPSSLNSNQKGEGRSEVFVMAGERAQKVRESMR
jgi:hypothetical protein